jgi:hypothetical protein
VGQVAEPFGITPDAARKRWGHWRLAHREGTPEDQENT